MPHTKAKVALFARLAPWVALLLGLAALWIWADRLFPDADSGSLAILEPSDCDLNTRDCVVPLLSGGSLRVSLSPRPAVALRPLELELEFSGQDPAWVDVDLTGVEMYMGYHRPRLDRAGPGIYRGEVTLPACASEAMTWAATVLPEGDAERAEVQLRFVSRRP